MATYIIINLVLASFVFGFFQDFADLLDEHGLKWFRGADIITGVVWGAAASYLIFTYPPTGSYLAGLLLYWLIMDKLDYLNHQLSATMMFFAIFYQFAVGMLYLPWAIMTFGIFLFFGIWAKWLKNKYGTNKFLYFRHYVPSVLISLFIASPLPAILFVVGMIGVEVSDRWFQWFEKTSGFNFFKKIGLSIELTKTNGN
jgi:hypothetical protein